jgi:PAS domain S-box-containing protein
MTSGDNMQNLHAAIIDQAQDAIIFADRSGIVRVWNRGAEVLFGYSAAEAVGQGLDIIIPEKFRHAHHEGFRHAMESGHAKLDGRVMTTRAHNKYGSRVHVDLSFALVKDATGHVVGASAIGRDVTARHQEQIAQRLKAEAQTAS